MTGLARIIAFGQSTPPAYDQIKLWTDYYADHVGHDGVAERVWRRADVRTRHLTACPVYEDVCRWSTAQRMRRFLDDALPLAKEAVGSALVAATVIPEGVGLLATVSCTGYANPGLDVHVAKDLGMRPEVRRLAVGHMGCYAAIPGLAVATDYVTAQRQPAVLVCTELPSYMCSHPRTTPSKPLRTRCSPTPARPWCWLPRRSQVRGSTSSPWKRLPTSAQRRT